MIFICRWFWEPAFSSLSQELGAGFEIWSRELNTEQFPRERSKPYRMKSFFRFFDSSTRRPLFLVELCFLLTIQFFHKIPSLGNRGFWQQMFPTRRITESESRGLPFPIFEEALLQRRFDIFWGSSCNKNERQPNSSILQEKIDKAFTSGFSWKKPRKDRRSKKQLIHYSTAKM